MQAESKIKKWMQQNIQTYVSYADEKYVVADSNLARDACEYFWDYVNGEVPHTYFDCAYQVGNEYEKQRNKR